MKGRLAPAPAAGTVTARGLSDAGQWPTLFTAAIGVVLGLTLLKFSNPPIMEQWVSPPTNGYEFVLGSPWPIAWAYALLVLLALVGVKVWKQNTAAPVWLVALPLAWVLWECIAATGSLNPGLSRPTVVHFAACALCFYLGYFALAPDWRPRLFWPWIIVSLLIVVAVGWEQHFGGLEQTRQYFFMYLYPKMKEVPPEYIKKLSSTRIFSTLFYPNALAGVFLLLLPAVLEFLWQSRERFTFGARMFLVVSIGAASLACLYWSGSKGGWLLLLLLGLVRLLRLPIGRTARRNIVLSVLVIGLAAFFWRYSGFFQKGATSVSARFDYWHAAVQTLKAHPFSGTGPGTFSLAYQKIKRPDAEMARLAHNDYLQQASDSGLPGFLLYSGFILASLVVGTRSFGLRPDPEHLLRAPEKPKRLKAVPEHRGDSLAPERKESALAFAVWLGVLGWSLQSLLEFGLYIPALAWPAFTFMGLLLGHPAKRPQPIHS